MALPEWRSAILTRIIDETSNTRRFFFEIPDMDHFDFDPGQFVTVDLPIHEVKNKRWRSYSIASAPGGNNCFELLIVLNEEGAGTTYMWQNWKLGSEVIFRGPLGKFTLPEQLDTDIYLICTGTGLAPFRSMVWDIYNKKRPHQNLYLIFGTRHLSDGLYLNELLELEQKMQGFYFMPTFSREPTDQAKYTGYVHPLYTKLITERQAIDGNLPPAKFFLCGWKNMIDEARQRLLDMGYSKASIHYELYG